MDERCKKCACLCKRLDAGDQPVGYRYVHLSPAQVTTLIQKTLGNHRIWHHLEVAESAQSTGNQIVVLIKVLEPLPQSDSDIILIVQGQMPNRAPTEIWCRYDVPEEYCDQPSVVLELTAIIDEVLKVLADSDLSLAQQPQPPNAL